MSLSIVSTPKGTVEGQESRWNGAFERFIFDLLRQDLPVLTIFSTNGTIAVVFTPGVPPFLPAGLVAGDEVYINNPMWEGVFVIDLIVGPNAFQILTPQGNIIGSANGGYVNFLDTFKNYRAQIRVLKLGDNNTYEQFGLAEYRGDAVGAIRVDLQEFAQVLALQENDFDYDIINGKDPGLGTRINIQWRELYVGNEPDFQTPVNTENLHYFTNEARQLGDKHGNNVAERVPFNFDVTEANKAKFCNPDAKLSFWPDYPFDLTFIYSDNIDQVLITRREERFDLNGGANAPISNDTLETGHSFVHRLMIKENYVEGTDEEVDVWLNNTELPVPAEGWAEPGYVEPGYGGGTGLGGDPEDPGDFVPELG